MVARMGMATRENPYDEFFLVLSWGAGSTQRAFGAMSMTTLAAFSTADLAPPERAPVWREHVWRHFGGLESDFYGDTAFDGRVACAHAGEVILTRLQANRHRVIRTPDMARASDTDYLKIVAPVRGRAGVEQHGRAAWVGAGGWTIYNMRGSYTVHNPESVEHLIVMLPRTQVVESGMRLDELMARPIAAASGVARVALDTMRNTYRELPAMNEAAARRAGDLVAQLVRLSLLELGGRDSALTRRQALKDRIFLHVEQNLRDPCLTIETIATALNCSKRLLHNAFSGEEETLSAYIQTRRLEACKRELRHGGAVLRPLTDIALSCGFTNISHFSRVFHAYTGSSPSVFRRGAASEPGQRM